MLKIWFARCSHVSSSLVGNPEVFWRRGHLARRLLHHSRRQGEFFSATRCHGTLWCGASGCSCVVLQRRNFQTNHHSIDGKFLGHLATGYQHDCFVTSEGGVARKFRG